MRKQYHTRLIGGDHLTWDVHRLVRLSKGMAVETIPLSTIAEVDELWWFQSETDVPTPRSMAAHMSLVLNADLIHPILLCNDGRLMDGMHRVVKALMEGRETVQAIRFRPTPEPDFVNVDVEALPYPEEEV